MISFSLLPEATASQWGPVFPTHRYPTDKSFHFDAQFHYGSQEATFDSEGISESLDGSFTRTRFTVRPEYQPNRQLALGAILNFDSLGLSGNGLSLAKSGFSDQYIFGEFRLIDERGYSLGFAPVFKIPLYTIPAEVLPSSDEFLLLGDGQVDGTILLTTEAWPAKHFKLLGDIGYTYRTDEHAAEVPFQIGGEYVSPSFLLGAVIFGNLSLKNDKAGASTTSQSIQILTGETAYAYARNPELLAFQIKAEYAFSPHWAIGAQLQNSIWGKNSPMFFNVGAGLSYRSFSPERVQRRAREVGLDTDDSSSEFEGEIQERVQDEALQ